MAEQEDLFKRFGIAPPQPFSMRVHVHVAESHNEMRLIFVHHLMKIGLNEVTSTRDGRLSLDELRSKPADVLILSKELESVPALDLVKELREAPDQNRPANILVTAPPGRSEIMYALESGIDDFLVKPVVQGDILAKIKSAHKIFNNPKNPERVYEYAKQLFRKGDFDAAFAVYKTLSTINQKAARPHVGMARCLLKQGREEDAKNEIAHGIKKNPNYVHAYELRGNVQIATGEKDKAVHDFRKAIEISPLNLARYESCCTILLENGDVDGCVQVLELAHKHGLDNTYISHTLGHCYFLKQDFPSALRFLKEAARSDPQDIKILSSLAVCYRDAKDFEKALESYNRAIKLQPENHQILFNKAVTLKHMKDIPGARKLLERVLQIDGSYGKARDLLKQLEEEKSAS